MKPSRRTFLTVTGSAAVASVAGAGTASAASSLDVPLPDNTSQLYPTMGKSADNPTATLYGNFKCPYTQEFVNSDLGNVVEERVKSGDMNLRFRQVAYEPNKGETTHGVEGAFISSSDPEIAAASLGVWDVSPGDYWDYFFTMFEELVSGTVTFDDLSKRMESAGVSNVDEIRARYENGRYDDLVEKSTGAARDLGVSYTPTLEVGETITGPRGHSNIIGWIDSHLSDAVPHLPQKDSNESKSNDSVSVKSKDKPTVNRITFDGSSANGWANYEFTVSGEIKNSKATKSSLEASDSVSGATAKGGVGPWKDTFEYTGEIEDLTLSQPIDVLRNGEKFDPKKLSSGGVEVTSTGGNSNSCTL